MNLESYVDREVVVFGRKWNDVGFEVTTTQLLKRGRVIDYNKSKGTLLVEDIYRGEGWDEKSQSYPGISIKKKTTSGSVVVSWWRGENLAYGEKIEVYKEQVQVIREENEH